MRRGKKHTASGCSRQPGDVSWCERPVHTIAGVQSNTVCQKGPLASELLLAMERIHDVVIALKTDTNGSWPWSESRPDYTTAAASSRTVGSSSFVTRDAESALTRAQGALDAPTENVCPQESHFQRDLTAGPSWERSAVSFWIKGVSVRLTSVVCLPELGVGLRVQQLQISRQEQVVIQLARRSHGNSLLSSSAFNRARRRR
jgi:hypothetical protein